MLGDLMQLLVKLGRAIARLARETPAPPPAPAQNRIDGEIDAALAAKRAEEETARAADELYEEAEATPLNISRPDPQPAKTAAPLAPEPLGVAFIPARNFTPSRPARVRLVVLHTTESPLRVGAARAVAGWFAGPGAPQASCHYAVDAEEVIRCVRDEDQAWSAPGANGDGLQVELCASAGWSSAEWSATDVQRLLERAAGLVAALCTRHDLPAEMVQVDGLLDGEAGITTHAAVSAAWHRSTHWDPGPSFPLESFIARVRELLGALDPQPIRR